MARRFDERERGFLRSLYELRYLGTRQIAETWYPEKSEGACGQRLRKLRRDGYLASTKINNDRWQFAWRLGGEGIRTLRRMFDGDFEQYKTLAMSGLPHLLDTNQVYLTLACGAQAWGGAHFEWLGSHRAVFEYETRKDGPSQLHPDAVITPAASTAPRVLLELDRGTEAIRGDLQRATIERKMRRFVEARHVVAKQLGDRRKVRLVFVVPAGAKRRMANVEMARDKIIKHKLDGDWSIEVVTLDDTEGLRAACGVMAVSPPQLEVRGAKPESKSAKKNETDLSLFRELFGVAAQFNDRWASFVAKGELPESRAQKRFGAIYQQLKEALGPPPIEPVFAERPDAAGIEAQPVVLERPKSVQNQVSPEELQILQHLHAAIVVALKHAHIDEKNTARWKSTRGKSLAAMERVGAAFGEHGEPQGFRDDELGRLLTLYQWGLYGLMEFVAGCQAYKDLRRAVKPATSIVARLCPTEQVDPPDPKKYSLDAKNEKKARREAEKEQAREEKAEEERLAREAEEAKKKGLGRLFRR